MPKTLPADLTSYDFLKSFAVIFMVIDHIGFYFFPEDMWWRAFGRWCVPIWFFLIGYAQSRDLGPRMWIGMCVLVAANIVTGMYLIPLNILGTMIAVRLLIDPVMNHVLQHGKSFWPVSVMIFSVFLPTGYLTEYGTVAFIMAMFGYLVRRRPALKEPDILIPRFIAFSLCAFIFSQLWFFRFSHEQFMVMAGGLLVVMGVLLFFKPRTYPRLTAFLPSVFVWPLQFMGRRTLEIYVAHLLVFKCAGIIYDPDRFSLFQWTLLPLPTGG